MSEHVHKALTSAKKQIVGGGSIAIEVCSCKALRSVVEKGRLGPLEYSDWELPEPEEESEDQLELLWDGEVDNDGGA